MRETQRVIAACVRVRVPLLSCVLFISGNSATQNQFGHTSSSRKSAPSTFADVIDNLYANIFSNRALWLLSCAYFFVYLGKHTSECYLHCAKEHILVLFIFIITIRIFLYMWYVLCCD